ncbi:hypothetical protein [Nocardioides zeicaulis]|uniref:C2H2-type domain-containing protein n=1 Tax=Nocardioides zeicaulis TaxID=1776857 RepID=A0ABV6E2P9_9ACTN
MADDVDPGEVAGTDIFDRADGPQLVCRVCGSLVSAQDDYRLAHVDWHEASNGA